MYKFNDSMIPEEVADASTTNALRAFLATVDISINEERYNSLPEWAKKYWKLTK